MMTVEFFGVRGFGPIGGSGKATRPGEVGQAGKTEAKDSASFSSALQGAGGTQAVSSGEDARAARVQELKQQVASGAYEPDLNKVASSLLKFLVEEA